MTNNSQHDATLAQTIIQLVQNQRPQTVRQLITLVKKHTSASEPEILEQVLRLQADGQITLTEPVRPVPQALGTFVKTAYWYWLTLVLATATTVVVYTIPEATYPLVYIRYVLGIVFVIWLPGYSLIKALFPTEPPVKTSSKNLDAIERIALSVGMSLALVPITGLILNYTPYGIRLTPIVLSLLILTVTFATAGIMREYKSQLVKNPSHVE